VLEPEIQDGIPVVVVEGTVEVWELSNQHVGPWRPSACEGLHDVRVFAALLSFHLSRVSYHGLRLDEGDGERYFHRRLNLDGNGRWELAAGREAASLRSWQHCIFRFLDVVLRL